MSLREKLKILVVDDMSVSRGLLTQALDQLRVENYQTASSGDEAMRMLEGNPVHLVISDFNMPGMDGLGLLQKIRQTPATAKLGFILVSGSVDANLVNQGASLGMNNYLKKPFSTADMQNCIEKVFGRL